MKTLLYAVLGFLVATVIAWGGLLAWAFAFLDHHGSYWDQTPGAADTFFTCWLVFAIGAAIGTARWARKRCR